ncbi:MAG TPA: wax ester/triacylglycerol synthase domain-containing protein [Acidimicrobiales bacterium]|nr:wax ester/triacylglycerol synthase domain-containing protein [Acidimicrobiales bacterium]
MGTSDTTGTRVVDERGGHVRQSDAFTWNMERDPLLRSTIVAVATFDRAPDWDQLVDRMDRASRLAPNFRRRLVPSPLRLAPPRFVPAPDFDLEWHVRRITAPPPHTFATVLEFARNAGMAAFDPARPLWECTLVDGLEDGGAAVVLKVHHSLTDGIGGIQLTRHLVDLEPDAPGLGPMPDLPDRDRGDGSSGRLSDLGEALGWDVRYLVSAGLRRLGRVPADVVHAVGHPGDAVSGVLDDVRSVAAFVRPVTRTLSPVMTRRRLAWHFETIETGTADLKRAGHAAGGSLNDAFLGGVTGGLRRYHRELGQPIDRLMLTMPISLRAEDDPEGGNRVTIVRFEVPVATVDPVARMRGIKEACERERHEPALAYSEWIAGVMNLMPPAVIGGMLKHVDFLASNVPGLTDTVWLAGARLEGFYAFGPTLGASANVTLMSYGDRCCIGVNVDTGAVSRPDVFVDCLVAGFEEVLDVGGEHGPVVAYGRPASAPGEPASPRRPGTTA